jgi:hypothetical protein
MTPEEIDAFIIEYVKNTDLINFKIMPVLQVRKGVIRKYDFDEELHKKAKEETQQYMEYLKNQEHLERCLKLWN